MKKAVWFKKYTIGFVLWLSLVSSVWYAANSGSIGSLFELIGWSYKLSWEHIKDDTITSIKMSEDSVWNRIIKNHSNFTMKNLRLYGVDDTPERNSLPDVSAALLLWPHKIIWDNSSALQITSNHDSQSSIALYSLAGKAGQLTATSQSVWLWDSSGNWLLKINKSTWNVWIWLNKEPATTWPNWSVTASAFFYSSDKNLKENIKTLDNSLEKVQNLRGVSFDWKKGGSHDLWLIAQEVEAVYPELVSTSENGLKSVKYANLVWVLIEAIKDQQTQIEDLKVRLGSLENSSK